MSLEVTGADDFLRLSKALKQAGRTGMRRELHNVMKRAAKPLVKEAQAAARETLPSGAGEAVARRGFRAQVRTGDTPGLTISAPGRYVTAKLTNTTGTFRHPVFADGTKTRREWTWVTQTVPGSLGWFDKRMSDKVSLVKPEVEQAVQNVIDQIVAEGQRG